MRLAREQRPHQRAAGVIGVLLRRDMLDIVLDQHAGAEPGQLGKGAGQHYGVQHDGVERAARPDRLDEASAPRQPELGAGDRQRGAERAAQPLQLARFRDDGVLDIDRVDHHRPFGVRRHLAGPQEAEGGDLMAGGAQRIEDGGIGDLEAGIGPGDGDQRGEEGKAHGVPHPGIVAENRAQAGRRVKPARAVTSTACDRGGRARRCHAYGTLSESAAML